MLGLKISSPLQTRYSKSIRHKCCDYNSFRVLIYYTVILCINLTVNGNEISNNGIVNVNNHEVNSPNQCGYLVFETKPTRTTLNIFEKQKIPGETFTKVYRAFRNGSVVISNQMCQIIICGFEGTSFGSFGRNHNGFGDCYKFSNTTAPVPPKPFSDNYHISSISCGCQKNRTNCNIQTCKSLEAQNSHSQGNCAVLYQENDCQDCYFDGIPLNDFEEFKTEGSAAIKSILIRPGCVVRMKKFGNLFISINNHSPDFHYKSVSHIWPTFFKLGEVFDCKCYPPIAKLPVILSSTTPPPTTRLTKTAESKTRVHPTYEEKIVVTENIIGVTTNPNAEGDGRTEILTLNREDKHLAEKTEVKDNLSGKSISTSTSSIVGGIGFLLLIIGMTWIIRSSNLCQYRYTRSQHQGSIILTKSEVKQFKEGGKDGSDIILMNELPPVYSAAIRCGYDPKYEIKRAHLVFDPVIPGSVIGTGAFGIVYKGTLQTFDENRFKDVAIKTVNPQCFDAMTVKSLLNEIKVHAFLTYGSGDGFQCPNIVYFLGACTVNIKKGEVFNVLEFCPSGSLLSVLKNKERSIQAELELQITPQLGHNLVEYGVDPSGLMPTIGQEFFNLLIKWSEEIAVGMEYLSLKGVLHIDLATRNVLLNEDLTAKISDFGLSRRLSTSMDYEASGDTPKPFKWIALESLVNNKYSVKSDVWAYGVTLWEMFSLGKDPYPLMGGPQLMCFLQSEQRLEKPLHSTTDIYCQMRKCWDVNPELRSSFSEIKAFFKTMRINYQTEVRQDN